MSEPYEMPTVYAYAPTYTSNSTAGHRFWNAAPSTLDLLVMQATREMVKRQPRFIPVAITVKEGDKG